MPYFVKIALGVAVGSAAQVFSHFHARVLSDCCYTNIHTAIVLEKIATFVIPFCIVVAWGMDQPLSL